MLNIESCNSPGELSLDSQQTVELVVCGSIQIYQYTPDPFILELIFISKARYLSSEICGKCVLYHQQGYFHLSCMNQALNV